MKMLFMTVVTIGFLFVEEPDAGGGPQAPPSSGLTAADWQMVSGLVDAVSLPAHLQRQLELLPQYIERLAKRESTWQGEDPARRIGWIARDFRQAGYLAPEAIGDRVVDDIIWHYEHAYGRSDDPGDRTRRQYREECARALAFIGNKRGLPIVQRAAREIPGIMVWQAVAAMPDESLLPEVSKYVAHGCDQNITSIVQSLGDLGDAALPVLRQVVESEDVSCQGTHVLEAVVAALMRIDSESALELLREVEGSLDPRVGFGLEIQWHRRALESSVRDGLWRPHALNVQEAQALNRLCIRLLASNRSSIDPAAEEVFVKLGVKGLPTLRRHLSSYQHVDGPGGPYWIDTPRVANVMVKIGDPAIPCLITALLDPHGHVRRYAGEALCEITGEEIPHEYEAWLQWWTKK